jgi:hypothetical protein
VHVRASSIVGMPVVDDTAQEAVGILRHPLVNPDTGLIEGFFLDTIDPGMVDAFLMAHDIVAWGTRIHVRDGHRVASAADFIRLRPLLDDPRSVLHQQIRVRDSRRFLGTCVDIQLDTRKFSIEWLFPRRWFLMRDPIPASEILEVTPEAIWVRDPIRVLPEEADERLASDIQEPLPAVPQTEC